VQRPSLLVSEAATARVAGVAGAVVRWLAASAAVALVALPVVAEQAVEEVSFNDSMGTLPVRVSLCHQGRSTLATGVLGDVHYDRTGAFGLGIRARATEPPRAGGTLASYVDPRFVRANLQFIEDPDAAVASYAAEFGSRIRDRIGRVATSVGLVGGLVVTVLLSSGAPTTDRRRRLVLAGLLAGSLVASSGAAVLLFERWPCNSEPNPGFAFPDVPGLAFSSPQTLELARQIRPFIEKNRTRIESRAQEYEAAATASFATALGDRLAGLTPRAGEVIVIAEADPQGGYVGTRVRTALEDDLVGALGEDAIAFRTISGDITSNGTIAEADYVALEAAVGGDLPVVAVAGDHDSEATEQQMEGNDMQVPDLDTVEVAGLRVSGANDVEHKALFGALVSNEAGMSEEELGASLRDEVSADEAGIVLLHQPDAAAGYLGVDMDRIRALAGGSRIAPYDDGIPDLPPGTVSIGHLHDLDGPWVVWNTGTDPVTWTVVDQLGTAGGMEERPTFNRFSTPISVPLKTLSFRLQYVDTETDLQTGFATVTCSTDGQCTISERTDVGLPLP
jgi:hypothetical protein